ncbi:ABC transporter substrate-binding protein [Acaryochloris marina]|uniref:ABC transporter substrate-binding protein n=1 Tax=Acaryochloris marina TaxID=155978 RepID=UPI001BB0B88A|nr:ABC transporter substrate-binding protein [Acaryochloris marina]QUY43804.1 ABC transporter substrate-binding protein [Acaryochloris marina S15]
MWGKNDSPQSPTLLRQIGRCLGIVLCALLLNVSSLSPARAEPVTISFLVAAFEVPIWKPLIAEFEAQHPDIRIEVIEGPSTSNIVEDLYVSAFLLGNAPYDLVYMDITWVAKFAAAGWLQDLSPRVTPEQEAQFLPGAWAGGKFQNKLYRYPAVRADVGALYYRQDLLDQYGYAPPDTFTDLIQISQALQAQGTPWGYLWPGKQTEGTTAMFLEVLSGFGGYWIDPETLAVGLDTEDAIAALDFLVNTLKQGLSPPGTVSYQEEENRRLFQNGQAVFMRNWPYAWSLINAPTSPVQGKVGIHPLISQSGQLARACQGGWGWGISTTSPHPEAAWQVIQFFSSEAAQRQVVQKFGYLPTLKSLYADPDILAKYPHFAMLRDIQEQTVLRPAIAQYDQASDILQRYLNAAFTQQLSPQAAMAAAARETRQLLAP